VQTLSAPPRALLDAFEAAFPGRAGDRHPRAGRINLLGGHVDIQDGVVINIAIDRGIWLAAARSADDTAPCALSTWTNRSRCASATWTGALARMGASCRAGRATRRRRLGAGPARPANRRDRRGLSRQRDHARRAEFVRRRRDGLRGRVAGAGRLVVACAELAQAGREAERSYMGLGTGIQDQITVLCAQRGQTFWLDCRSLDTESLPLPDAARAVVCDTLTRREWSLPLQRALGGLPGGGARHRGGRPLGADAARRAA